MAVGEEVKLSISGAALAALLHRCGAAAGDCDGLLFGRAHRPPPPAPTLSDYDDQAPAAPCLFISISGHSSLSHPCSLSDPLGRPNPPPPSSPCPLSKTLSPLTHPLLFILVSPSASDDLSTHSFDYRAFLLVGSRLVPTSLTVVNVGPGFRDQYHSFAPESPFPLLTTQPPPAAPQAEDAYSIGEQKAVDAMVDGFGLGRLQGLVCAAAGQAAEMDSMYAGMLHRMEKLAREVEKSNHRVLDQEKRNLVLRYKTAGLQLQ
ncbi:unnamed protein product [Triticum turgidum subsp. durum]|uniref:Uncharacterized protein n=1 Tax=Triticum turgidum subsp. durum TaxID=4567 RepID=A0A9R1AJL6_TRITD|nr:unnamed protein product [Triticum turgidum subsp. durum]